MGQINKLVREIHDTAVDKGWYDTPRTPLELQMLIVSEIAEACEEARNDNPAIYQQIGEIMNQPGDPGFDKSGSLKPEGEAVELADAVIRIMDYFAYMGWDLEKVLRLKIDYNKTRSYRHGGKRY